MLFCLNSVRQFFQEGFLGYAEALGRFGAVAALFTKNMLDEPNLKGLDRLAKREFGSEGLNLVAIGLGCLTETVWHVSRLVSSLWLPRSKGL